MSTTHDPIDQRLLDRVSAQALESPRRRKNHNFHAADAAPCHRLLNALAPGTYVQPHRHLEAGKDETVLAARGRVGLVLFDAQGAVEASLVLEPGGATLGAHVPAGVFHTVLSLSPGSVYFEAKAGPYRPVGPDERASWAPAEGAPEAVAYLERLLRLFA